MTFSCRSAALISLITWPARLCPGCACIRPGSVSSSQNSAPPAAPAARRTPCPRRRPSPRPQPGDQLPVMRRGARAWATSMSTSSSRRSASTIPPFSVPMVKQLGQPYIGQTVSFSDLNQLTEKINALYASKGDVTAHAILPPQNIENGAVHRSLVEGRVGEVGPEGRRTHRRRMLRPRAPAARRADGCNRTLAECGLFQSRTQQRPAALPRSRRGRPVWPDRCGTRCDGRNRH